MTLNTKQPSSKPSGIYSIYLIDFNSFGRRFLKGLFRSFHGINQLKRNNRFKWLLVIVKTSYSLSNFVPISGLNIFVNNLFEFEMNLNLNINTEIQMYSSYSRFNCSRHNSFIHRSNLLKMNLHQ